MDTIIQLAIGNILSPMVLFFALGVFAGLLRSDLAIPEAISKGLSLYLMLAIGFKGGVELASSGFAGMVAVALVLALALSFSLPIIAYALLRAATRLDVPNAAAIAAHYGSVSIVTFVAATGFLGYRAIPYEGYVVAMLALMETPAIVTGLLLARRNSATGSSASHAPVFSREVAREVFLSGGVVLLGGSFAIGWITGDKGMAVMAPAIADLFKPVLAVFLLDMGLLVGRRLHDFRAVGWMVVAFGIYMPLIGAMIGLLAAHAIGLSLGGITLVAVLAASASYIVVPAAMRLSLPQANPAIYVPLSLAVTFPFNLVVGIPLYHAAAQWIAAL
ncbi:MAG: sodium-dependent bicarbonate transport family permease [Methylacidiphilales bacterium]|nr:sodium-dependent bicarbonate transport family permease [Candidatus Methylacidiphilales bacterium]